MIFRPTRGNPPDTLIFLHIPKTAGVCLHAITDRHFPPAAIHGFDPNRQQAAIDEFKAWPEARRRQIRLLRGHVGYGLHAWLPGTARYFTVLRHPVERAISHYIRRYIAAGYPVETRPWLREATRMSLEDYIRHGSSSDLRNGQVKQLSGTGQGWDTDRAEGQDPGVLLTQALAHVEGHFLLVGLTERFDETALLLSRAMGWGMPFHTRRNVTPDRPRRQDLSSHCRRVLEDCNEADMALYRHAQQRFETQVREAGRGFKAELAAFRLFNWGYGAQAGLRARLSGRPRRKGE